MRSSRYDPRDGEQSRGRASLGTDVDSMRRALLVPILLVLVAGAAGAYVRYGGEKDSVTYRTATVERGPLTATVSAKGTLSAVNNVQVGTQVSGQIKELLVDFNSPVQQGQLL